MAESLGATLVFGYLAVALVLGIVAGRRGGGGVTDFVAGDRAFGPVVMYFVMGATIFSAFALLGTPQRVVEKGSDAFYVLGYGAIGFVPVFFFGAKVRRIGARLGHVTQGELVGGRFDSRLVTGMMGAATLVSFLPYMVIQLKGAGIVMHAVTGWSPTIGAAIVYGVVTTYVVAGGVRGVGWTNVLQGIAMLIVIWVLGFWIVGRLYGSVDGLFDAVAAREPEYLVLPGPGPTSSWQWSSEILVSSLGFSMWPQVFMKCFTARSARLVQLAAVLYPTFLFFLLPLVWLGYVAVLEGGPASDQVLLWLLEHPGLGDTTVAFGFVAFAILAASMSTGDALLHAGGSITVRDVLVGALRLPIDERRQTLVMRVLIVAMGLTALAILHVAGDTSVVDLLLLAYAIPIQFLPPTLLGLYWARANRQAAQWGLAAGLVTVVGLFLLQQMAPDTYLALNPVRLQIGFIGAVVNTVILVGGSLLGRPMEAGHLRRYGL